MRHIQAHPGRSSRARGGTEMTAGVYDDEQFSRNAMLITLVVWIPVLIAVMVSVERPYGLIAAMSVAWAGGITTFTVLLLCGEFAMNRKRRTGK